MMMSKEEYDVYDGLLSEPVRTVSVVGARASAALYFSPSPLRSGAAFKGRPRVTAGKALGQGGN